MKPKNREFKSTEEYQDGKYRVFSLSDGNSNLRRVVCDKEGICLIPFDTDGGKIKNVYLAKYMDYLSNEQGHTCITSDFKDESDTIFEELDNIINGELGVSADVNDMYLLGNIKHNLPFSKTYKCYGLNLDNHSKDLNGFKLDLSDDELDKKLYSLDKVKLTRVLKGDIEDSLCMSAALLLISYID
jgi:hypothetical protein